MGALHFTYTVSTKKPGDVCTCCLLPGISPTNLGQFSKSGTVLETSEHADYKTVPDFEKCPRFVGDILDQRQLVQTLPGFFVDTV